MFATLPSLDEIREKLNDYNLTAVAKGAGVHPNSLYHFMKRGKSPRYDTIKKVLDYIQKNIK